MITLEPPGGLAGEANPWVQLRLSRSGLSRFLRAAKNAAGIDGEVHVLLADDTTLKRLNRTFRGKNKATDVLSFPAASEFNHGAGIAGDLAISLEAAARQAEEFGHTLRDEIRLLLLHGTLHLAGFDHELDRGEMAAREAELRRELRLPSGLIARAGAVQPESKKPRRNAEVLPSAPDDERNRAPTLARAGRRQVRP